MHSLVHNFAASNTHTDPFDGEWCNVTHERKWRFRRWHFLQVERSLRIRCGYVRPQVLKALKVINHSYSHCRDETKGKLLLKQLLISYPSQSPQFRKATVWADGNPVLLVTSRRPELVSVVWATSTRRFLTTVVVQSYPRNSKRLISSPAQFQNRFLSPQCRTIPAWFEKLHNLKKSAGREEEDLNEAVLLSWTDFIRKLLVLADFGRQLL